VVATNGYRSPYASSQYAQPTGLFVVSRHSIWWCSRGHRLSWLNSSCNALRSPSDLRCSGEHCFFHPVFVGCSRRTRPVFPSFPPLTRPFVFQHSLRLDIQIPDQINWWHTSLNQCGCRLRLPSQCPGRDSPARSSGLIVQVAYTDFLNLALYIR
jgi:hypothetical protein